VAVDGDRRGAVAAVDETATIVRLPGIASLETSIVTPRTAILPDIAFLDVPSR